jgi:PAS domain S-box-containing protein
MALRLLGAQTAQELVGRDALDLVHPDFHQIAKQRHEMMKRSQSILPPVEGRLVRLDGATIDVEVRTVPFTSDDAQMFHVAVRDITERRHAERERASLEAALRQAQRLEAIGTLTGGIAHDFNNILSSIVGNIQLVMDDLPSGHPARQSAHEIRNATNRARDLVKRLMTFSREQETPQSRIAVAPLIDEVQQLMRPALPSGVELRVHVPADTPAVIADATQLHQVLVNLCTNASQAMPSGQGQIDVTVTTISATDACSRSRVALEGAKRYVCIEVRDTGSGIAPEVADRVFEPFFTTKRAGEGSGLGLAVVHGIIQSHKGAITVSSRMGVGTSFFVYLPASELPVPVAQSTIKKVTRGANQHVLYIDDEEPLVFLVTRVLERSGYRCTGCTDPPHAMHVLAANPQSFDLVITDMNMPGMSGIDVARQVLEIRPELPVVITTGYVRSSDIAAIRDMGVRDLILKPDTIEELAAVVGRYLQQPVPVV